MICVDIESKVNSKEVGNEVRITIEPVSESTTGLVGARSTLKGVKVRSDEVLM